MLLLLDQSTQRFFMLINFLLNIKLHVSAQSTQRFFMLINFLLNIKLHVSAFVPKHVV
jgi:hypothetical protein